MSQEELGSFAEKQIDAAKWLESTKSTFLVVDNELNILYCNNKQLPKVNGQYSRPGDLLHCLNAASSEKGCGSTPFCNDCRLRNSVKKALSTLQALDEEVTLALHDNHKLVLQEKTTPFEFENNKYAIVFVTDISDQKREKILERVFFHDMMNLTGALDSFVNIMNEHPDPEVLGEIKKLTGQIMDELSTHKELIYAENGILNLQLTDITITEFMRYAAHSLSPMAEEKGRQLVILNQCEAEVLIHTDTNILHRIILNMVKNAIEASQENENITLTASADETTLTLSVHNPGAIPQHLQSSIFHYGISSKGEGRGIGTYSMKLFGENYLKGKVWFTSNEEEGTTFFFSIPLQPSQLPPQSL